MAWPGGYLLDTNILLHLLRGKEFGERIDQQFGLRSSMAYCVVSVVTIGEMNSLARRFNWGHAKMTALSALLDEVPRIDINDPAMFDAYGTIDHYSTSSGLPMGKNDVWIAATAHVTRMTLLTTDKDFDPLDPTFLKRIWINPDSR